MSYRCVPSGNTAWHVDIRTGERWSARQALPADGGAKNRVAPARTSPMPGAGWSTDPFRAIRSTSTTRRNALSFGCSCLLSHVPLRNCEGLHGYVPSGNTGTAGVEGCCQVTRRGSLRSLLPPRRSRGYALRPCDRQRQNTTSRTNEAGHPAMSLHSTECPARGTVPSRRGGAVRDLRGTFRASEGRPSSRL